MIFIYTQPSCSYCDQVKALFAKSGLVENEDYSVVDISNNEYTRDYVKSLGFRSVPVTQSKDNVIHGYKPLALGQLINDTLRGKSELPEWDGETEDGRYLH